MENGIYSAVSGAVAQVRTLENVSNNLANVSTTGFKGTRLTFNEVLGRATRGQPRSLSFVRPAESRLDLRPGALKPTGRKLDVALEGAGYLCVRDGTREVYTRGGSLQVRADGVLADAEGYPLLGRDDRPLTPGADVTDLTIDGTGRVSSAGGEVGVLKLVEFARPKGLQPLGANRVAAPAAAGAQPAAGTRVRQAHLEASNVNAITEVSSMIVASRAYETVHNIISTFRQVDSRAANDLGGEGR